MEYTIIEDADRVKEINAELFRNILDNDEMKLWSYTITKEIDESIDKQCICLKNEENLILTDIELDIDEPIDLEEVADCFIPAIIQHLGLLTIILHEFAERFTVSELDSSIYRKAIVYIACAFIELGGYFQIESKHDRHEIYRNTFNAIKFNSSMKKRRKAGLEDINSLALYDKVSARITNNLKKNGLQNG